MQTDSVKTDLVRPARSMMRKKTSADPVRTSVSGSAEEPGFPAGHATGLLRRVNRKGGEALEALEALETAADTAIDTSGDTETGATAGAEAEYLRKHSRDLYTDAMAGFLKLAARWMEKQQNRLEQLEKLINIDELTGLLNRRGFMQILEREQARTNRNLSRGGLLIHLDLDNNAEIFRSYGPQAGQAALKLVAKILQKSIRRMDSAARLEHDSFVVIMPDASRNQALQRAQTIGWNLCQLRFPWGEDEVPVRVSLSLREYQCGDKLRKILAGMEPYSTTPSSKGAAPTCRT